MAWFGLTAEKWANSLQLQVSDFTNRDTSGKSIIEAELENCEAVIRSYIPEVVSQNLRYIRHEIVVEEAWPSQPNATLGAPVADADTLVLWLYAQNVGIYELPTRGNGYEVDSADYTLSGQVVTIDLSEGDQLIASYATSLEDDCPSLRRILATFLNYNLAIEQLPAMEDRYRMQYDQAIRFLERVAAGTASIEEIKRIKLFTDINPRPAGGSAFGFREPA